MPTNAAVPVRSRRTLPLGSLRTFATGAGLLFSVALVSCQLVSDEHRQETLEYLYSLQKNDGSFGPSRLVPKSDLPTTSAAVRAIVYLGGRVPNKEHTRNYLRSCQNADGGFGANPGASSEVRTTALAVLALVELGENDRATFARAIRYLETQAKTFEDIRIAAAAFEALAQRPNKKTLKNWQLEIARGRNPDGTFGQGGDIARDTGSAVACLLRLGLPADNTESAIQAILQGQRADGGWGREAQPSDLETTYRVLRALYMLKAKPNLGAVAKFVASCRTMEGAYALRPGDVPSVQATYFASAILRWLRNWP
ncbi:MAG: terpene cyclase/mutase family protein [Gemmatales bacterium]|nr:terpene cyclase/mutase family protein [Gemmatales bacterium]MDW7995074.1 terpene cyclase/mutase family protein [Gemmatales bacterium]